MSRITEYTPVSAFDENDVLIKDGENGTKIISVEDAAAEFRRLCGIDGDISQITESLSAFGTNLAGVETTFIATKNYNIGDLFVIDGVLYRATATIASDSEIDPETNCEETSFSTVIEAMNDILAGKADANGTYDDLIAGNAKQLVGTVFTEDDAAYTFRTAGGSADIGDREYDEIVGGSIVWNQMVDPTKVVELSMPGTRTSSFGISEGTRFTEGHKYLFVVTASNCADITLTCNSTVYTRQNSVNTNLLNRPVVFTTDGMYYVIGEALYNGVSSGVTTQSESNVWVLNRLQGSEVDGATATISNFQLFDLTQMFGPTIADYIYNLETATPGAGMAWFRKYFPKDYYEPNAGELMHVSDLQSHDMVGFNIASEPAHIGGNWNANGVYVNNSITHYASFGNNKWAVVPGMDYCVSMPNRAYTTSFYIATFDKAGNHIGNKNIGSLNNSLYKLVYTMPSDVHYIGLYLYRNVNNYPEFNEDEIKDICINLSWDGERDGEYEPYVKHSYPLDSSLTLRGIPKLSTDGKLYYDGDHYKADGTVERRYGIVDLGTLNWTYASENTYFQAGINGIKGETYNALCSKYLIHIFTETKSIIYVNDKEMMVTGGSYFRIKDASYTDAASFKEAMSGVYLVYELEEPTTETATAYQSPQIVDDFGTEEYVTSSIVPVGHETKYDSNLRAKLEMAPNSPDGDGDYLVRQTSGQNEYIPYTDGGRITALEGKVPSPPSMDGAYVLKCTVADGTPTYSWVSA